MRDATNSNARQSNNGAPTVNRRNFAGTGTFAIPNMNRLPILGALLLGALAPANTSHAQTAPNQRAFTRDAQAALDGKLEEAAYQAILEQAKTGRATIVVRNMMVGSVA